MILKPTTPSLRPKAPEVLDGTDSLPGTLLEWMTKNGTSPFDIAEEMFLLNLYNAGYDTNYPDLTNQRLPPMEVMTESGVSSMILALPVLFTMSKLPRH